MSTVPDSFQTDADEYLPAISLVRDCPAEVLCIAVTNSSPFSAQSTLSWLRNISRLAGSWASSRSNRTHRRSTFQRPLRPSPTLPCKTADFSRPPVPKQPFPRLLRLRLLIRGPGLPRRHPLLRTATYLPYIPRLPHGSLPPRYTRGRHLCSRPTSHTARSHRPFVQGHRLHPPALSFALPRGGNPSQRPRP